MTLSPSELSDHLQTKYDSCSSLSEFNQYLYSITNIADFFKSKKTFAEFRNFAKKHEYDSFSTNNKEWGDIQTPKATTSKIIDLLKKLEISPDVIIEPTYGTGNFLLSSIEKFKNIKKIYGIEVHKKYEWSFKSKLLSTLYNSKKLGPEINLSLGNIFNHNFDIDDFEDSENILIIGNPPWVTNTELSLSESANLPEKTNFKRFKGIDAITGKSNFDLAEIIILQLLEIFSSFNGEMVMLCKNIVIKNLVKELPKYDLKISDIRSISIDSKAVFGKNVDASLLIIKLGKRSSDYTCKEVTFENPSLVKRKFGWVGKRFVSNISEYAKSQSVDGICCFDWRSGIKHDCASVLELTLDEKMAMYNKSSNLVNVESDTLYPLLKGSMIKGFLISKSDKRLIITQKKVGADTKRLEKLPKLWEYLGKNSMAFKKRKSVIYKKDIDFSIFGVGKYSFAPYKVAIAAMYKEPKFSLCVPINGKPVLYDDTCYFLGFDTFEDALFVNTILNSEITVNFLKSISFLDSKRPYTKENLSRIDLYAITRKISFKQIQDIWCSLGFENTQAITDKEYAKFKDKISKIKNVN